MDMRHKRIKRDYLLPGDIKVFHQAYGTKDEAITFAKMSQRHLHNSRIYVRRNHITISTRFSADSWFLALLVMATEANKNLGKAPAYIINTMSTLSKSSRRRETMFICKDGQRIDQRSIIDEFVKTCRQYEACIDKF